jgi:DNA-directed RNA polymerase subunit beta
MSYNCAMTEQRKDIKMLFTTAENKREEVRSKVTQALNEVFPFVGSRYTLEAKDIAFDQVELSPEDHKRAVLQARTISEPVRGTLTLRDNATGKVLDTKERANLAQIPLLTPMHSFIVNGVPYTVNNQLRVKPGVYTRKRKNEVLEAAFNLSKGDNFRLSMDQEKGLFNMEYGTTKIPLYSVLNKLGVSDDKMAKAWNPALAKINREEFQGKADKHIERLYDRMVYDPIPVEGLDEKLRRVKESFEQTAMDPKVNQRTLGKPYDKVTPEVLLNASGKLLKVYQSDSDLDERESMAFKQVKSVDDFFAERIRLDARGLRRKLMHKIERGTGKIDDLPSSPFTKGIRTFLTTSSLKDAPTQINPVEIIDSASKVTLFGEGGIGDIYAVPAEARRLHLSQIGVIDPVRTPDTIKAGVDLRTTLFTARDRDGNIYTLLRDAKTGRNKFVPVEEAADAVVGFPNQGRTGMLDAIEKSQIRSVSANKIDYYIPITQAMYSPATNLIPLQESVDGNRQMMASKMMTQALPLLYREAPLVQVKAYAGSRFKTMEDEIAARAAPRAPFAGTIGKIKDGYINIKPDSGKYAEFAENNFDFSDDMIKIAADNSARVSYYQNFPLASKTYLDNPLLVKQGDQVRAGQQLTESPYIKDGTLALGTNLTTAYLPYRGMNSNDAIVISEGAAKKLTSTHMYKIGEDIASDMRLDRVKHQSYFGNKYTAENYANLDETGVIKPGSVVRKGDLMLSTLRVAQVSPESEMLGRLHKSLVKPYRDASTTWEKDYEGRVVDVMKHGSKIRVTVRMDEPMVVGSKLSGRFGDKGVVSTIVPDDQMIQDETGRPIDVLLSPATVMTRLNPAQILEAGIAKVAQKTGKPIAVENFSGRNNVDWVKGLLKENGLKDKETVFDPITGKSMPGVFVGPRYFLKLFKTTDTNYSARGVEDYDVNQQPSRGGISGAKSLGRLTFNGLLAHNARGILKESAVLKSQKNDEFWRAYQLGLPLPAFKTTFAYDKFGAMLAGAGVKMNKSDNAISIGPLIDRDITQMSSGAISNSLMVRAKDLKAEPGGLFDPNMTGGTSGTKYSHVALREPVVNPIFERPAQTLLGMTQKEFEETIRTEGGGGIRKRLASIDLNKRNTELRDKIDSLKGNARDNAVKELKYIKTLRDNNIGADEAYTLSKVPVIPPMFRPVVPGRKGNLLVSDSNYLYRDVILANDALGNAKSLTPEIQGDARTHLQNSVAALFGTKESLSPQLVNKGVRGFIDRIAGTGAGPKFGYFQEKLVSKKQDLSGRGTIVPDMTLGMDEIGIPEDALWNMYRPFVMKGLVLRGYQATDAKKMIDDQVPLAREVLMNETKDRPILFNRAPALYRYNVLAAYPKPVVGKTIRVHEMQAPVMSGDFDGDAIQIYAPVTNEAVNDARRMTLSNMLISDQEKHTLTKAAPHQEAVTGVYLASMAKPTGAIHRFENKADAQAAYMRGEINLSTPVEIKK